MLFNSFVFLTGFLPCVLVGFYTLTHFRLVSAAKVFLVIASLVFYGWFTPRFVMVLLCSMALTFLSVHTMLSVPRGGRIHFVAFLVGLVGSLGNLIFWKYTNFAIETFSAATGLHLPLLHLVLPLGISFYSFQQLTFVLDAYAGRAKRGVRLLDLSFCVVFFPHLIVGPIVRYDELLPQVTARRFGRLQLQNVIVGAAIFIVGLAKKVIVADNLALMVDPTFERVGVGEAISAIEAWRGAIAYTSQLYFDFSGYSDMAIGAARAFGLLLPINFHSPLKGRSILDFWRRWHITLTRMTTSYIFTPVSMAATRYVSKRGIRGLPAMAMMVTPACFITFVLIGLWHGASWTFLLFGLVHTVYAVLEYLWRHLRLSRVTRRLGSVGQLFLARFVTYTLVAVSLVLFRAPDVSLFWRYLGYLSGGGGELGTWRDIDHGYFNIALLLAAVVISQAAPNTQQIFARYRPGIFTYVEHERDRPRTPLRIGWAMMVGLGFLFVISLAYIAQGRAEFLYAGF